MPDSRSFIGPTTDADDLERFRDAIRRENFLIRSESRRLRRFCQARRAARLLAAIAQAESQPG
jgi:hypothetical protein